MVRLNKASEAVHRFFTTAGLLFATHEDPGAITRAQPRIDDHPDITPTYDVVMTKHAKQPSTNGALSEAPADSFDHESPIHAGNGAPTDEQIRIRAYEIYLERGEESDDCVGNWLQAEFECRQGLSVLNAKGERAEMAAGD